MSSLRDTNGRLIRPGQRVHVSYPGGRTRDGVVLWLSPSMAIVGLRDFHTHEVAAASPEHVRVRRGKTRKQIRFEDEIRTSERVRTGAIWKPRKRGLT